MKSPLDAAALDQIFLTARSFNRFHDRPVDDATLRALYNLYQWGPTSMNCQPARLVFVRGAEAKARLKPALPPGNVDKTMAAPVVAIVAHDVDFHEQLPKVWHNPAAKANFDGDAKRGFRETFAFRNGSLQGAYLMLAARALGLAVGPMSGFNPQALNEAFFPDGRWKANFLVNIGWPDPAGVRPRGPRLAFEQVARVE